MAPGRTNQCIFRGADSGFNSTPATAQTPRNIPNGEQQSPSQTPTPMNLPSPHNEERNVYRALQDMAPELDIERIVRLQPAGIQTRWSISLANGQSLVLCGPPEISSKQALRSEDEAVAVEVAVVQWLASLPTIDGQPHETGNHILHGGCEPGRSIVNYTCDSVNVCYVSDLVPKVFKHFPRKEHPGSKTLALWEPTAGTTIAQLGRVLTEAERNIVDFEKGQLFRRLACHVSPTGNFGPVGYILRPESQIPKLQALGLLFPSPGEEPPSDIGRKSWSSCFKGYLEEVANDLGDFYIHMNFEAFRNHYHRFEELLDKVHTPRLVAIRGLDDANIMISVPGETDHAPEGGWFVKRPQSPTTSRKPDPIETDHKIAGVTVTGLRDWSTFCFGDPLMAYVFQNDTSSAFQSGAGTSFSGSDPLQHENFIEDPVNAPVRLALYKAWHAACGVAREYRRVRDDETDWELVWRAKFTEALKALDEFDDNGNQVCHNEGETSSLPRASSAGRL